MVGVKTFSNSPVKVNEINGSLSNYAIDLTKMEENEIMMHINPRENDLAILDLLEEYENERVRKSSRSVCCIC